MIESAHSEHASNGTQVVAAPRVYYLADAQGRMASYYNAMELPEEYTTSHGIPRTNHFIPVGYCCMEGTAPRHSRYRASNQRKTYRPTRGAYSPQQSSGVRFDGQPTIMEPRAPPSSPDQHTIKEATPAALTAGHHPLAAAHASVASEIPAIVVEDSNHQLQVHAQPLAQLPCSSATCTNHNSQKYVHHSQTTPTSSSQQAIQATPAHHRNVMPAICRRWLIGTCRRGPNCRNRHYIMDETDAELRRIKDAHLATTRFYNHAMGVSNHEMREARVRELPSRIDEEKKESGFVEVHVEGVGKMKVPVEALSGHLKGLKLGGETKEKTTTEVVVAGKPVIATEPHLEPLPDYSLSMPPIASALQTMAPAVAHPAQPAVHPAEHFRASSAGGQPPHVHAYPRRYPQQDFLPRHVLDRALRQYMAGSFRGRRFLGPRYVGPSARKKAIVVQMKSAEVEVKNVASAQGAMKEKMASSEAVSATVIGKEDVEVRVKGNELLSLSSDGEPERKVETHADKPPVVPALLVELAHV